MHIIEMTAENIKRIKAIKIVPKGNAVILEGKNAQGKSSALDCIAYALGGKKLIPDNPIREGQETAFIEIKLGDYTITRNWTAKNTYLKIENKDGFQSKNPQNMLDAVIGDLSFDPMAFCNYNNAKRIEILKKITKLDFSDLETTFKAAYEKRTNVNRQLDDVNAQLKNYELIAEPALTTRTLQQVEDERKKMMEHNASIYTAQKYIDQNNVEIGNIEQQLVSLKARIAFLVAKNAELEPTALLEKKDTSCLAGELAEIMNQTALKEKHFVRNDLLRKKTEFETMINGYEKDMHIAKEAKESRIKAVKMPIEGLMLAKNDVSFNGVDFSEISTAQKIKVSMSIAIALNPSVKIIRIMNGSLLDSDSMAEIIKIAEEKDYQIFLERVADKKSNNDAIFIHDGEII